MAVLEQPKKPTGGAYGQFLAEKRAEFTKACKGQPVTAVSKMAGDAFKKLSEAEKAPFQKRYEAVKEQYEKDLAAFTKAGGVIQKGAAALRTEKRKAKEGGGKKKKDPNAPKKPVGGAYGCFLAEKRPEFAKACTGQPITAVTKMAADAWKKLSDAEKKPYESKYAKKMEEHKKAMAEYKEHNPDDGEGEDEDSEQDDEEEEDEKKAQPKKKSRRAGA